MKIETGASWFVDSFGARYSQLYAHRSQDEAAQALQSLEPDGGWARRLVLDVACGAGRHLRELSALGASCVGLDLSPVLLAEAKSSQPDAELLRGDMRRLPAVAQGFDDVLCMFTSFGYFESKAEHRDLALELARVAARRLIIDLPNPSLLAGELVAESSRELADFHVVERRWMEDEPLRVCKETRLVDSSGQTRESYQERVMLFDAAQVAAWLEPAGMKLQRCLGDYDGSQFSAASSRRQLCVFDRTPS